MASACSKILAGAREALAIARGESEPARIYYPVIVYDVHDKRAHAGWEVVARNPIPDKHAKDDIAVVTGPPDILRRYS